ncbi:hypothetical protein [Pelistega sp. MC2]|uniref:hypothetical protein n=1 Tax=Pelistega sp. MC2 TaxID=1720297 RepID=UPI0008DAA5BD|nr:hypothetical protein [Pelistega sp. MC2]
MHINPYTSPFRFVYKNSKGHITKRSLVRITQQSSEYLSGIQEFDHAYRTFRKAQILEVLDTIQKWWACEAPDPEPEVKSNKPKDPNRPSYINYDNKLEICFTGFGEVKRAEMEKRSLENNLFVRKSVTKNLSFLCTGPNAGPKKVEKALEMGLVLMDEQAFNWLIETGEIPV